MPQSSSLSPRAKRLVLVAVAAKAFYTLRLRILLTTIFAALVIASPAAADWQSADFTASWPQARGRTFVYHFTVPPSYNAVEVTVDGSTLYGLGRWNALTCPTFTVRSSLAAYTVRYSRDSTYVTVYFRQGLLAYLCFSGYAGGDVSDVSISYYQP